MFDCSGLLADQTGRIRQDRLVWTSGHSAPQAWATPTVTRTALAVAVLGGTRISAITTSTPLPITSTSLATVGLRTVAFTIH